MFHKCSFKHKKETSKNVADIIFNNISPKCLLETLHVSGPILLNIWNEGILKDCKYPYKLKLANVSLVYKKENPFIAKNYGPVSVLSTITETLERLMQSQLNEYINQFLSPFLCFSCVNDSESF